MVQQMQQILKENEEDLGNNASLVLDKDNINKVKDLNKNFSQAIQDYKELLVEDDNFISNNREIDKDKEGEDNKDNTSCILVFTILALNRSTSSTPVLTIPS